MTTEAWDVPQLKKGAGNAVKLSSINEKVIKI